MGNINLIVIKHNIIYYNIRFKDNIYWEYLVILWSIPIVTRHKDYKDYY